MFIIEIEIKIIIENLVDQKKKRKIKSLKMIEWLKVVTHSIGLSSSVGGLVAMITIIIIMSRKSYTDSILAADFWITFRNYWIGWVGSFVVSFPVFAYLASKEKQY